MRDLVADFVLELIAFAAQKGYRLARAGKRARQAGNGDSGVNSFGNSLQRFHINVLNIADIAGINRGSFCPRLIRRAPAKRRVQPPSLQRIPGCQFNRLDRRSHPPQPRNAVDPAHKGQNDGREYEQRQQEQDETAGFAIITGAKRNSGNDTEDESTDEHRQGHLRHVICNHQGEGAGRRRTAGGCIG